MTLFLSFFFLTRSEFHVDYCVQTRQKLKTCHTVSLFFVLFRQILKKKNHIFLDRVDTPVFDLLIVNYRHWNYFWICFFLKMKIVSDYVLVDFLFPAKNVLCQICNKNGHKKGVIQSNENFFCLTKRIL